MVTKSEAFPRKWIKAADLQGCEVPVTIDRIIREEVGEDLKWVLHFRGGQQKPLILNQTNWDAIELLTGCQDTNDWAGHEIALRAEPVSFKGKTTLGVRVKSASRRGPATGSSPAKPRLQ